MKKILIPVSNSFFVRNFLMASFIAELKNNFEIIFLAPKEKISYYIGQFGSVGVRWDVLPVSDTLRSDNFFKKIEGWSIHSRFVYLNHWYFFKKFGTKDNWLRRFSLFPLRLFLWQLGRFVWWRRFVRLVYAKLRSKNFEQILKRYQPGIVFAPSINLGSEWALLRAAKRFGIKTIGMTPSWDNFYTKTFLRVFPDSLFVQTNLMKEQAIRLTNYSGNRIYVTGIPQYDRYFKKVGLESRESFFNKIGADPSKKLILFGCSGKVTYNLDKEIIDLMYEILKEDSDFEGVNVLVRPHPKRTFSAEFVERIKTDYGFLAHVPIRRLNVLQDPWEFDEQALWLLANSLAHADVVITTCTTFFIEAAIFDRPLIAIAFDRDRVCDFWNSARRFLEWDHLADLIKTGGVWKANSREELQEAIRTYLNNPNLHRKGRSKIVKEQAVFTDGNSVKLIARYISTLGF